MSHELDLRGRTADPCRYNPLADDLLFQPTCGACGVGLIGREVIYTRGCHHLDSQWIACCAPCGHELWGDQFPPPEQRSVWDLDKARGASQDELQRQQDAAAESSPNVPALAEVTA